MARELAERPPVLPALADLLTDLGVLCAQSGLRGQAGEHLNDALEAYERHPDPDGLARAHRELGTLAWSDGDVVTAENHFASAERAQRDRPPSLEVAELAYVRMVCAMRVGDAGTVATSAKKLRDLAARLGSTELTIRALLAEAARDLRALDFPAAERNNLGALELARGAGEPYLEVRALDQLSTAASIAGDLPTLRRYSAASLTIVRRLGARTLEPWPRMRLAMADLLSGEWDRALRTTSDVLTGQTRFDEQRGRASAHGSHAWLLTLRGRTTEAAEHLGMARVAQRGMSGGETHAAASLAAASTVLLLGEERYDEAVDAAARLQELASTWYPMEAAMILGEALGRAGRMEAARSLSQRLLEFRRAGTHFAGAVAGWVDSFHAPDGQAAVALDACGRDFDRLGFPFHAAQARLELAARVGVADRVRSVDMARDALAVFERLPAPHHAQLPRRTLRRLGEVP